MKSIILLVILLFAGCSNKYKTYHAIQKRKFEFDKPHNPVTPLMRRGKKEVQETCEGQIFFNRNAVKITQGSLPALIRYSCPGSEYLVDAKITETWWTTIIYSRSCIKLESFCPITQKRE